MAGFQVTTEANVSNESIRCGKYIAGSYINRIENKPKLRPSPDRLVALAAGLGVPAEELFARAIGVVASGDSTKELELLARFRKLSPKRKADVLKIVDMWYSQSRLSS